VLGSLGAGTVRHAPPLSGRVWQFEALATAVYWEKQMILAEHLHTGAFYPHPPP